MLHSQLSCLILLLLSATVGLPRFMLQCVIWYGGFINSYNTMLLWNFVWLKELLCCENNIMETWS